MGLKMMKVTGLLNYRQIVQKVVNLLHLLENISALNIEFNYNTLSVYFCC